MAYSSISPRISVVVVALNEASNLRLTVEQLEGTIPIHSEIVVVDDGSTDGSTDFLAAPENRVRLIRSNRLGVAKARNRGARHATGDIIVFADAHVAVKPGWWIPMVDLLANPSVGAVAPVISDLRQPDCRGYGQRFRGPDLSVGWLGWQGHEPHQAPLLPGAFWAMRRDTFEASGGFDEGMIGWGSEDNELSLRLWLLGYELWVAPQVEVAHLFQEYHSYPVEWRWVISNKLRLAFLHFDSGRTERVVEALREHKHFASALALVLESDFPCHRRELASRRSHPDAWYFQRFGPDW